MGSQRVARPSLESGMEVASGKKRTATRRRHRGKGRKRQKTPSPPHNVPHTPLGTAGRVAFYYFVFLKHQKCIRSGPSQGFSRIRRGIRRHPRVRWQICESKCLVFRTLPCDVAAWLIEIARACNETWCVLGPSFVWGYLSSVVCNFIDDLGVSASIEISWLRYHVKTRARRGSSFSRSHLSQTTQVGQLSHSSS